MNGYRDDDVRGLGFCPHCGNQLSAMTTENRGYCETHGWQFADWNRHPPYKITLDVKR